MFSQITMINYSRPLSERAKARKFVGPYRWTPSAPGRGRGFYQASTGLRMDPRGSSLELRLDEANDHLGHSRQSNITAYWCDDGGFCTMTPIVARLPNNRGFLAGWTMGEGMAAALDATIYPDATSAAYAAHSMAEYDAEAERDYHDDDEDADEAA